MYKKHHIYAYLLWAEVKGQALLTMQTTQCILESLCDSDQQKGKVTRLF